MPVRAVIATTACVVLIDVSVGDMAAFVVNVQAGAVLRAVLKEIVQAVAAVIPVICPLFPVDPAANVPEPQEVIVGATLVRA